jgi:hypothetical protein
LTTTGSGVESLLLLANKEGSMEFRVEISDTFVPPIRLSMGAVEPKPVVYLTAEKARELAGKLLAKAIEVEA